MDDLTPNIGMHWYFFSEVFTFFQVRCRSLPFHFNIVNCVQANA